MYFPNKKPIQGQSSCKRKHIQANTEIKGRTRKHDSSVSAGQTIQCMVQQCFLTYGEENELRRGRGTGLTLTTINNDTTKSVSVYKYKRISDSNRSSISIHKGKASCIH